MQLNKQTLQNFLQNDNIRIQVHSKNRTEEHLVGESLVDFYRLKHASIVEQENTMKKQLSCAFPIINSNNISNAKGEIEIVLSIEDFGDVENRESFVSQIDQQSNKNAQNYNKPQTKEAKEHINVELEDVQSSQQQFVDQFANVVNSSKQMQNLKSKFEQHNNININKRENIDQS